MWELAIPYGKEDAAVKFPPRPLYQMLTQTQGPITNDSKFSTAKNIEDTHTGRIETDAGHGRQPEDV